MLNTVGIIIALIALFYAIGRLADIVVMNTKRIGEQLGIKVFFLGLLIGLLTSAPEFFIGISALAQNAPAISLGTLIGGTFVLFGLILGGSILLNRRLATDGKFGNIFPVALYLALPFVLGFDGEFSFVEGLVFVLGYFFVVHHLYRTNKMTNTAHQINLSRHDIMRKIFFAVAGIAGVVLLSNLIVRFALLLVDSVAVSPFLIGLLFFGVGTNLPELTITIRSWYRHIRELSLANLLGSAMANVFILGIFSLTKTLPIAVNNAYYALTIIFMLLLGFLVWSYKSDRALTRKEGFVFLFFYALFILSQILFATFAV